MKYQVSIVINFHRVYISFAMIAFPISNIYVKFYIVFESFKIQIDIHE